MNEDNKIWKDVNYPECMLFDDEYYFGEEPEDTNNEIFFE